MSAFLNGELEEEVYVEQPLWYMIEDHEDKVYRLKKVRYNIKQMLCTYESRINGYLLQSGFMKSQMSHH